MVRRLDGCQGTDFSWLAHSAETLEHLWIAESLLKRIFYIQVILSNQNEANYKLTEILQVLNMYL
jgi:hypothetical protein